MHVADPEPLPDIDTGLHIVRWKAPGFLRMRRDGLLDPKREFELVNGMVLHRAYGSPRHDTIVAELARRLETASCDVRIDQEMILDDLDAVVTPDITVVDGLTIPLVVEVSDDAPRLDGQEKELYAQAGVEVYWHIDLAWKMFYAHKRPWPDGYGMRSLGPNDRPAHTGFDPLPELVLDDLLDLP